MGLIYKKHRKVQMFQKTGKFGVDPYDPNSQQGAQQAAQQAKTNTQGIDNIFKDPTQGSGEYDDDIKVNSSPFEHVPEGKPKGANDTGGDIGGGGTTVVADAVKKKSENVIAATTEAAVKTEKVVETVPKDVVKGVESAGGGLMDSLGGAQGAAGIGGMVAGVGAGLLKGGIDDGDDENYSGGEKAADIGSAALEGAAAGAAFGPWGMAAGAVIGTAKGFIDSNAKDKAMAVARDKKKLLQESERASQGRAAVSDRASKLTASSSLLYGDRIGGNQIGYGRKGLKFIRPVMTFNLNDTEEFEGKLHFIPMKPKKIRTFKRGGKVKASENIIPNGVLHEEKNSLGDKGMPVVKCNMKTKSCDKKYEIEKDEMILTLNTTKKVEELVKSGDLDELGKFVASQVANNTHSFTDKYKYLNNNVNETIFG